MPRRLRLGAIAFASACALCTACSPGYVIRAGWEEAQILLRREKIGDVLKNPETTGTIRQKLELVADVRDFAQSVGLKPEGSFTYFTQIDRKVLVWVLTAAPKFSLKPYTWWFPIVGNVPYKGYFDKEDAVEAAKELQAEGYDAAVRPSLAFSTLGWFDDPMLSTLFNLSENDLVDTVIHEVLHNTIWVPNHVAFNESLANVAGGLGAVEYYQSRFGEDHSKTIQAAKLWEDQLLYAEFLEELITLLEELYAKGPAGEEQLSKSEVLEAREELFAETKQRWAQMQNLLQTKRYRKIDKVFNNAALVGARIYMTNLRELVQLYEQSGGSLKQFIPEVKDCIESAEDGDPFDEVKRRVSRQS